MHSEVGLIFFNSSLSRHYQRSIIDLYRSIINTQDRPIIDVIAFHSCYSIKNLQISATVQNAVVQYGIILLIVCIVVPCQHELVRRAGKSITHMQQQRHHTTARGLNISTFTYAFFCVLLLDKKYFRCLTLH